MPAPPPESDPAMVHTMGGFKLAEVAAGGGDEDAGAGPDVDMAMGNRGGNAGLVAA